VIMNFIEYQSLSMLNVNIPIKLTYDL